jgi:hypothetical protein
MVAGLCGLMMVVGLRGTLLAVGLAAVVGLLAAWVLVLPRRLAPSLPAETLELLEARDRLELTDARLKLQNDLRTTALQAIGGLAVLAGAVLAFQQLTADRQQAIATQELTRQGQASERFTRAIDQLGSERLEVRLGGIYGLEQIAQQAPDNRLAVTEVLVAFLHRSRPPPLKPQFDPTRAPYPLRVRAPDVQAALTVLVRRRPLQTDPPLDLRDLDLRGADIGGQRVLVNNRSGFREGDLRRADLRGSDLRGATFREVYLSGANFGGADLSGARFRGVNLSEANFGDANLIGADFFLVWARRNDASNDFYPGQAPTPDPSDSGIEEANFHGALADNSTRWPYGFDWRAAVRRL